MRELTGKLALVTGGARGVGKAVAAELAARGAHVLINYFHSHEAAKATKAELEATGAKVDLLRASVARPEQVEQMFAKIREQYGYLDVLVNNAANGALVPVDEVTDELLDKAIDTNYKGGLRCARLAAPLMAARGGGSIITVSALGSSNMVMANYLACAPAKAAAEAVTRYLAVEFAPLNIRVNTASAAMLRSDVADDFPDAARMQQVISGATPMGRLGTPEEFAAVVAFLASEDSRWITGQVILADGGLSLGASLLSPPAPTPAPEPVTEEQDGDEIAVVGMGLTVAGANSPDEFWQLRMDGAELFTPVPEDRWERGNFHSADPDEQDKGYQDNCVFITDFVPANGAMDGLPTETDDHELTTKWLRHSLVQALDGVHNGPDDRCSFLVGYTPDGSQHLEEAGVIAAAVDRAATILDGMELSTQDRDKLLKEVESTLAGRYWRGASAPSRFLPHRVGQLAMSGVLPRDTELQMVDTACSSSLYAIDIGAKGLLMGKQDIAVCGGAFALGPRGTVLFSKLQGLSKRGDVRSLDAEADGVVFADGAAVVVLKRLSRAKADGDKVLAVLRAFGSSSDGKGKAIYAPNSDGQDLAVRRALAGSGPDAADVDWIIAHATGTPAGDLAEFTTLRQHFGASGETAVTSNKSLVGHTGWAAGVVSVIEGILGLDNEIIPPQHRFTATPDSFRIDESDLDVPVRAKSWPKQAKRPRSVAVSGFGFGGTNAHLIVGEPGPGTQGRPSIPAGRVAVVGWSAHVPGLSSQEEVRQWLRGGAGPAASFGEFYPVPPFTEFRLPPPTVRTIDRCQLMIVQCAHDLRRQLGELWQEGAERAGVFVGNLGPTRSAMLYANRCYLDDIDVALAANPQLADSPALPKLVAALRDEVRRQIPPSTQDAFPGMMPNVISARVANYFDLKGPNITVDSGLSSMLSALDTAQRYLLAGELEFALVSGINGNVLPEYQALVGGLLADNQDLAEGAFMTALTTEENAERYGLPVLGYLDGVEVGGQSVGNGQVIECGASSPSHARYLGAAGGLALAQALAGVAGPVSLVCDQGEGPTVRVDLTVVREELPERFRSTEGLQVSRYVPRLQESALKPVREQVPFFAPGTVVLTDQPALLAGLDVPAGVTVLHHLDDLTPESVAARVGEVRHVRVLTDFGTVPPQQALEAGPDPLTRLHDAAFLLVQNRYDELQSFFALLLGDRPDGRHHPCHGLFSALVKCVDHELPDCLTFGLFTAGRDVAEEVRRAERESTADRLYTVVFHDTDGLRKTLALAEDPIELPESTTPVLSTQSVVLATGGARGITAEVMKELARTFQPRIYLLGSNSLEDYPAEVFAGSDEEFSAGRKDFIRAGIAEHSVAELNRRFNRMIDARAAHRTIAEIAAHCGPDRVTYLTCDVTDEEAVAAAVGKVLAAEDRIDLVVNAAGRNRSAVIRDKDFAEFRAIRDLKLLGYRNLKSALRDRPPAMWCNFGSLLGYFGLAGELDYGSGNDFLATAADYCAGVPGTDEFTIGWSLWDSVGIGANELTKAYFKRNGSYTHMTIEEGLRHFIQELHAPNRHPFVFHMGEAERNLVNGTLYPGYLESTARTVTFERVLSDVHMKDHVVRGIPTLPGTWITEMAAEAALSLVPGLEVIGFTDLKFLSFLRAGPCRITAEIVSATEELTTVRVEITADVVSPQGILLVKDKPRSTATVLLARKFPTAPMWAEWLPDEEVALPDPYHLPDSPVQLSGPFVANHETRLHVNGKRARFQPALIDSVLAEFQLPTLLLDAMVRTEVLSPVSDNKLPVAVPLSIRRIDLYQRANDRDLLADHGALELYGTPDTSTVGLPDPRNRFVAATRDGRIVAQIKDVEATAIGHLDIS